MFDNVVPDRLFIFLTTAASYIGDFTETVKSSSYWNRSLKTIEVYVDNEILNTYKIVTPGTGTSTGSVNDRLKNIALNYSILNRDHRNPGFVNFDNVYTYDILGGIDTSSLRPKRKGNMKIRVTTETLSADMVLIVMAQRNTFFQVDAARNVY